MSVTSQEQTLHAHVRGKDLKYYTANVNENIMKIHHRHNAYLRRLNKRPKIPWEVMKTSLGKDFTWPDIVENTYRKMQWVKP